MNNFILFCKELKYIFLTIFVFAIVGYFGTFLFQLIVFVLYLALNKDYLKDEIFLIASAFMCLLPLIVFNFLFFILNKSSFDLSFYYKIIEILFR